VRRRSSRNCPKTTNSPCSTAARPSNRSGRARARTAHAIIDDANEVRVVAPHGWEVIAPVAFVDRQAYRPRVATEVPSSTRAISGWPAEAELGHDVAPKGSNGPCEPPTDAPLA